MIMIKILLMIHEESVKMFIICTGKNMTQLTTDLMSANMLMID